MWQTQTAPAAGGTIGQTQTVCAPSQESGADTRQTQTETPPFDTSKYSLGKLCPRRHEYGTTGQSLLRRDNRYCPACDREKWHEKYAPRQRRPRQVQPAAATTGRSAADADAAFARMQALQAQGLTLAQIAAQLTAEGLRTK